MSRIDPDPAQRPLLFPDPVIEYYMARVDRAAIRERLKLTPAERLAELQREADARIAQQPSPQVEERPNEPGTPPKFYGEEFQPLPSRVPMLFPDAVIAAYMRDVDRTILRENLRLTVGERLERFAAFMRRVYGLRGGGQFRAQDLWEQHDTSDAGTSPAN